MDETASKVSEVPWALQVHKEDEDVEAAAANQAEKGHQVMLAKLDFQATRVNQV
jgi:hypothetical protein